MIPWIFKILDSVCMWYNNTVQYSITITLVSGSSKYYKVRIFIQKRIIEGKIGVKEVEEEEEGE